MSSSAGSSASSHASRSHHSGSAAEDGGAAPVPLDDLPDVQPPPFVDFVGMTVNQHEFLAAQQHVGLMGKFRVRGVTWYMGGLLGTRLSCVLGQQPNRGGSLGPQKSQQLAADILNRVDAGLVVGVGVAYGENAPLYDVLVSTSVAPTEAQRVGGGGSGSDGAPNARAVVQNRNVELPVDQELQAAVQAAVSAWELRNEAPETPAAAAAGLAAATVVADEAKRRESGGGGGTGEDDDDNDAGGSGPEAAWLRRRRAAPSSFSVHAGPMVCTEKLSDNPDLKRSNASMAAHPHAVVGGEMEGTGILTACRGKTPALIVKGVCDDGATKSTTHARAATKADVQRRAAGNAWEFLRLILKHFRPAVPPGVSRLHARRVDVTDPKTKALLKPLVALTRLAQREASSPDVVEAAAALAAAKQARKQAVAAEKVAEAELERRTPTAAALRVEQARVGRGWPSLTSSNLRVEFDDGTVATCKRTQTLGSLSITHGVAMAWMGRARFREMELAEREPVVLAKVTVQEPPPGCRKKRKADESAATDSAAAGGAAGAGTAVGTMATTAP